MSLKFQKVKGSKFFTGFLVSRQVSKAKVARDQVFHKTMTLEAHTSNTPSFLVSKFHGLRDPYCFR
jgi:hypothetical protein